MWLSISAGAGISKEFAADITKFGAVMIDNPARSVWRMMFPGGA